MNFKHYFYQKKEEEKQTLFVLYKLNRLNHPPPHYFDLFSRKRKQINYPL